MSDERWPFDQPRNCASISLRSIVFEGAPILHITHDLDDHSWQFLGLDDAREADACVISLEQAIALDPSILEVADLAPGWHAWRSAVEAPWCRAESRPDTSNG